MDKIDPIDSFNAWNLSIVCGPTTKQQEAFQSSGLRHRLDSISEQSQIIKAESTYVSYIRDGVRCFISQTLRKELFITDGYLFKESKTKIKLIKGKYRQIFVSIDFKKLLIRFKAERQEEKFEAGKDMPFQEIIEVRRLELDIFKGEHKKKKEL